MAAPPRLGATLLLLLLLAAPPPGGGNEGGALGLCKCLRLTSPPSRLQDLADKVRGHQACGQHLVRFELPRGQICGLASANWVTELRRLWEKKEAGRIDARQGGGGLAPNPTSTPPAPQRPPPHAQHGPTPGAPRTHRRTPRAARTHGQISGAPRTHRRTPRAARTHGQTPGAPRTHRWTSRATRTHGQTHR
ncbi:C-X-C motif chemokine 16 isoform X1 [Chrysemys picta bellii]|uniref:C-X-C motif chemokine 16 isoform X1 n=1 Tax=Chrysemys picta bellii TaxID=8478 RepID=UPI0032B25B96